MNIAEFLRSPALKNIYKRLPLSAAISKRSIIRNLAFAQRILLKFLFQNEDVNNYEITWFYQKFKRKNLWFLNLYSVPAARILDLLLMLSPPK